jgi:hypothetical protein
MNSYVAFPSEQASEIGARKWWTMKGLAKQLDWENSYTPDIHTWRWSLQNYLTKVKTDTPGKYRLRRGWRVKTIKRKGILFTRNVLLYHYTGDFSEFACPMTPQPNKKGGGE